MSGECQGDKGCGANIGRCDQDYLCEILVSNFELDIMQPERVLGVSCGVGVFPRADEDLERHPDTVDGDTITGI